MSLPKQGAWRGTAKSLTFHFHMEQLPTPFPAPSLCSSLTAPRREGDWSRSGAWEEELGGLSSAPCGFSPSQGPAAAHPPWCMLRSCPWGVPTWLVNSGMAFFACLPAHRLKALCPSLLN